MKKNFDLINHILKSFIQKAIVSLTIVFLLLSFIGCSLSDRPGEVGENGIQDKVQGAGIPVNGAQYIYPKSMFFNKDGKAKTFLCGWADFDGSGSIGTRYTTENFNKKFACNVQFKITETHIQALLIDPNVYNANKIDFQQSDKWIQLMSFKVRHLYKEDQMTSAGRKLNKKIYTEDSYFSKDSPWQEAPYVKIQFETFQNKSAGLAVAQSTFAEDIEVVTGTAEDKTEDKKTFIGFTNVGASSYFGASLGVKTRYNFLEIKPDSSFQKQYYNIENSDFVYPLFTIGRYNKNLTKEYYLSKWNLSEDKPIEIVLNNWPDEYRDIVEDSIFLWNNALTQANKPNQNRETFKVIEYFKISDHKPKFGFDLRYSSINWFSDEVTSVSGPLGIAMVNPYIMTGEIMWGNVNVYGGALDLIINRSMSQSLNVSGLDLSFVLDEKQKTGSLSDFIGSDILYNFSDSDIFEKESHYMPGLSSHIASRIPDLGLNKDTDIYKNLFSSQSSFYKIFNDTSINNLPLSYIRDQYSFWSDQAKKAIDDYQSLSRTSYQHSKNLLSKKMSQFIFDKDLISLDSSSEVYSQYLDSFYMNFSAEKPWLAISSESGDLRASYNDLELLSGSSIDIETAKSIWRKSITSRYQLEKSYGSNLASPFLTNTMDLDRTVFNAMEALSGMSKESIDKIKNNENAAKRAFIKEILLHELGHFVGLGHNFKSNILPDLHHSITKKKNIPSKIYQNLSEMAHGENDYAEFSNFTAIMGYPSMETVVNYREEELMPGFQDVQVLTYIYSGMYPVYDEVKDSYVYKNLESHGIIPKVENAYLPHCGDWISIVGIDPYCSKFDRGYNAQTIIENEVGLIVDRNDSIKSRYTDVNGSDFKNLEARMWNYSFSSISKIRKFYDYMRYEFRDVFDKAFIESLNDREHKLIPAFSRICMNSEDTTGSKYEASRNFWDKIFNEKPQLLDLCKANGSALALMGSSIINQFSPEYSQVTYGKDQSIFSMSNDWADQRFSQARLGQYTELSLFPSKFAAFFAITSPHGFIYNRGYIFPSRQFTGSDGYFEYKYLYPDQYADIVMLLSKHGINLNSSDKSSLPSDIAVRRELLAFGFLSQTSGNDRQELNPNYVNHINGIIDFEDIKPGWLLLNKVHRNGSEDHTIEFNGSFLEWGQRDSIPVLDVMLHDDLTPIAKMNETSMVLPLSKIIWVSPQLAFSFALFAKTKNSESSSENSKNPVFGKSISTEITTSVNDYIDNCFDGYSVEQDLASSSSAADMVSFKVPGLKTYFYDSGILKTEDSLVFEGFDTRNNIHTDSNALEEFKTSVNDYFEQFYPAEGNELQSKMSDWWMKKGNYELPDPLDCLKAKKAIKTGFVGASILSGSWGYTFRLFSETMRQGQ